MSYERKIPWGNDEIVYVISNGTRMSEIDLEPDNVTNESHPSLVVQAVDICGNDEMASFLQALGESEWSGQGQLSEEDIGEIRQVVCGQPSNWKLTSIRLCGYGLCFDFHNFGRGRWKNDQRSNYPDTTEGLRAYHEWEETAPPDHVWYFLEGTFWLPTLIVKEFNKKVRLNAVTKFNAYITMGAKKNVKVKFWQV